MKEEKKTLHWVLITVFALIFIGSSPLAIGGVMASAMMNASGEASSFGEILQMISVVSFTAYPYAAVLASILVIILYVVTRNPKWIFLYTIPLAVMITAFLSTLLFFQF